MQACYYEPCYILCVCKTVKFGTTRCQVQSYVKVYFSLGHSKSRASVQFVIVAFVLQAAAWPLQMRTNELACTCNIKAVIWICEKLVTFILDSLENKASWLVFYESCVVACQCKNFCFLPSIL